MKILQSISSELSSNIGKLIVTGLATYVLGLFTQDVVYQALQSLVYHRGWYIAENRSGEVAWSVVLIAVVVALQLPRLKWVRAIGVCIALLGGIIWAAQKLGIFDIVKPQFRDLEGLAFIGFNVFVGGLALAMLVKVVRFAGQLFIAHRRVGVPLKTPESKPRL